MMMAILRTTIIKKGLTIDGKNRTMVKSFRVSVGAT